MLKDLRQRTADLTELLERQTAMSEVLRVISSSPSELTPVFETMLANATRLCGANFGTLNLHDKGAFPRSLRALSAATRWYSSRGCLIRYSNSPAHRKLGGEWYTPLDAYMLRGG